MSAFGRKEIEAAIDHDQVGSFLPEFAQLLSANQSGVHAIDH
jgi:hypothetical protein